MNTFAISLSAAARIIATIGRYAVEAAMHEVDLPDHSLHRFHFVRDPGEPAPRSMFMRAITLPDGCTYVVDLRHLESMLRAKLPPALERDRPGFTKFALRQRYLTAADLHRTVIKFHRASSFADQQQQARAA